MIRFSASLVVVGVGLLIAGGVTSKLLLIYIAIGVSALALLFLILGAILHRAELFGREPEGIAAGQTGHDGYADEARARPEPAVTAAATPAATAAAQRPERRETRPTNAGTAGAPGKTGTAGDTGSQPLHTFAGYEQFTTQAERRRPEPLREDRPSRPSRPSQPSRPARSQPPFVDPQPTRMDWAADLRKAEKQELERQERERRGQTQPPGRADVPAQNRPERGRPDRGQAAKPFVEPEPTRMDWARNLREAEKQELGRQTSEREARPASPGPGRPGSPPRTPEPAPAEATRAERVQQPADATRAEKIITAKPDDETPVAAKDQPPAAAGSASAISAATQEPAAAKAEDKEPAAEASAAPPQEDQKPAADAADAAAETKSPADLAETAKTAKTAEGDDPEPGKARETSDRGGDASRDAVPSDQDVTVVPGVPRFHRSECILIRFMGDNDLQRMPAEQARQAGCTPCRACQPDGDEDE